MSNPRIEELRRRIQKDPASIAFAQLAEEHRRAGQLDEAVAVCRAGLAQHPAYLSARITLGRALLEMGRYDEAAAEFQYVHNAAPDNLTATRELADTEQRRAAARDASEEQRRAAARDASEEQRRAATRETIDELPRPEASGIRSVAVDQTSSQDSSPAAHEPPVDPVVAELETWLSVLAEERAR